MGAGPVTTAEDQRKTAAATAQLDSRSGSSGQSIRTNGLALQDADSSTILGVDWGKRLKNIPAWLVSLIFHLVVLIILGLWSQKVERGDRVSIINLTGAGGETGEPEALGTPGVSLEGASGAITPDMLSEALKVDIDLLASIDPTAKRPNSRETSKIPLTIDPKILEAGKVPTGGGLEGRGPGARGTRGKIGGPTDDSESAVERGLRWLVAHQRQDGSWRFDHSETCSCRNTGSEASTTAATAIALLPFLGAGYTHKRDSEFQETVEKGIYYLGSRMLITPNGGDLQEGTMYAQGLGTIALCEAYAMTGDETLKPYAKSALQFILFAQDKKGGGWRYTPGQPGDTTVFGWQLMGLKSGILAKLDVRSTSFMLADRYLNSVQTHSGAGYGYQTPKREETTTAVGLLSRMYLGWRHDHEALRRGVDYLDKLGPSKDNMYYNYYATQVMHHFGGSPWYRWNSKMRDYLVSTQAKNGHESGSWYFDGGHAETGGRLYNTAMCVMTLEVYYRYMPLYQNEAVDGDL